MRAGAEEGGVQLAPVGHLAASATLSAAAAQLAGPDQLAALGVPAGLDLAYLLV